MDCFFLPAVVPSAVNVGMLKESRFSEPGVGQNGQLVGRTPFHFRRGVEIVVGGGVGWGLGGRRC